VKAKARTADFPPIERETLRDWRWHIPPGMLCCVNPRPLRFRRCGPGPQSQL